MWAAIKSDFKEFASGAVEETTAVASKVSSAVTVNATSANNDNHGHYPNNQNTVVETAGRSSATQSSSARATDGSVLLASAALSMGERGLKGLSSVSSMIGGVVAPRGAEATTTNTTTFPQEQEYEEAVNINTNKNSSSSSVFHTNSAPSSSSATTSMFVQDYYNDDDEEELGWDDDDDDDDLDLDSQANDEDDNEEELVFEKTDDATYETNVDGQMQNTENNVTANTTNQEENEKILIALEEKLSIVQNEKMVLQQQHRDQTAELVELRARVEEFKVVEQQQQNQQQENVEEVAKKYQLDRILMEEELQRLKMQLDEYQQLAAEKEKVIDDEEEQERVKMIASLVEEKELLDVELKRQAQENEQLLQQNQTLHATNVELNALKDCVAEDKDKRIKELEMELLSVQNDVKNANVAVTKITKDSTQKEMENRAAIEKCNLELEQSRELTSRLEQKLKELERTCNDSQRELDESKTQLDILTDELTRVKEEIKLKESKNGGEEVATSAESVLISSEEQEAVEEVHNCPALPSDAPSSKESSAELVDDVTSDDDWGDGDWGDDDDNL